MGRKENSLQNLITTHFCIWAGEKKNPIAKLTTTHLWIAEVHKPHGKNWLQTHLHIGAGPKKPITKFTRTNLCKRAGKKNPLQILS